jgi:hypothetical protein
MSRKLKIESRGDYWRKRVTPMVRLKGKWLEVAGFPPGASVRITVYAPECMDLRLEGGGR